MYCKNLRKRSKKGQLYIYCTTKKKIINFEDCRCCQQKEYKEYKPIKSRTNRLNRREKERFSIIYQNLSKCCNCGSKIGIEKNEIFEGSNRQNSMIYGMVAPFCKTCHEQFHNDIMFSLFYKVKFQKEFLKTHSLDEFIKIFGQDYIYKLEQQKKR